MAHILAPRTGIAHFLRHFAPLYATFRHGLKNMEQNT
jgi:hypothetical protein